MSEQQKLIAWLAIGAAFVTATLYGGWPSLVAAGAFCLYLAWVIARRDPMRGMDRRVGLVIFVVLTGFIIARAGTHAWTLGRVLGVAITLEWALALALAEWRDRRKGESRPPRQTALVIVLTRVLWRKLRART